MSNISMVDLQSQYHKIKTEIDKAVIDCLEAGAFIKGPEVQFFEQEFAEYLGVKHVISCGNGTDALQLALMALELKPGDEVIVPAFTYVATAEVVALLGLTPILVDVDRETFNVGVEQIKPYVTSKTKAIVPVHLFGQCVDMEPLLEFAAENELYVVEDAAQATGVKYRFSDGNRKMAGTMSTIGCTSFFPTKNLGCYGDGGALMTDDDKLAEQLRMIANHGQTKKYYHGRVGVNSRLDSVQAAILRVKLRYLDEYIEARRKAAQHYDSALGGLDNIQVPVRCAKSDHAFHQYTLRLKASERDKFQQHLERQGIPSVVYYPLPLHHQEAFRHYALSASLPNSEQLCKEVLSLPIHTELDNATLHRITSAATSFYPQKIQQS